MIDEVEFIGNATYGYQYWQERTGPSPDDWVVTIRITSVFSP